MVSTAGRSDKIWSAAAAETKYQKCSNVQKHLPTNLSETSSPIMKELREGGGGVETMNAYAPLDCPTSWVRTEFQIASPPPHPPPPPDWLLTMNAEKHSVQHFLSFDLLHNLLLFLLKRWPQLNFHNSLDIWYFHCQKVGCYVFTILHIKLLLFSWKKIA